MRVVNLYKEINVYIKKKCMQYASHTGMRNVAHAIPDLHTWILLHVCAQRPMTWPVGLDMYTSKS